MVLKESVRLIQILHSVVLTKSPCHYQNLGLSSARFRLCQGEGMPAQKLPVSIPEELMSAVLRAAEHDADMVWGIMHHLGERAGRPNLINEVSFDFVIQLGAALRLLFWEWNDIYVHRDAGLPEARDALLNVFQAATDVEAATNSASLPIKVFALLVERLAWAGPEDLDADLILGEIEEDVLLNAMADFVWDHRRDLPNASNTTEELP